MNSTTVTIVVLDYSNADVDIIHHAPQQENTDGYEKWLATHCNYNPDEISFMIFPHGKAVVPNHFTPEDFN